MHKQHTCGKGGKQKSKMRTKSKILSSVLLLKWEGRGGKARAMERQEEFTKAAQEGPHYDIKQDLISESDLMR